ncbi:MAG TPA: hypothetical protein VH740_01915 [Vicinamibacterales bacterium]
MRKGLAAIACAAAVAASALLAPSIHAQDKRVNPDAKAIAGFQRAVADFVELRHKAEQTLPALPAEASAEQIDQRQRVLADLVQKARRGAKQGDIFTRDVRPVIRRLLHGVFAGPDGIRVRMAIMEENPGEVVRLGVNARYPDTVPLSNVPPQILRALPPLPEGIEYRFIGTSLVLLDTRAHIIADYLTGAVPR